MLGVGDQIKFNNLVMNEAQKAFFSFQTCLACSFACRRHAKSHKALVCMEEISIFDLVCLSSVWAYLKVFFMSTGLLSDTCLHFKIHCGWHISQSMLFYQNLFTVNTFLFPKSLKSNKSLPWFSLFQLPGYFVHIHSSLLFMESLTIFS